VPAQIEVRALLEPAQQADVGDACQQREQRERGEQ
jgi:hypothetical protein